MAGRNDLARAVEPDLNEMKEGSKQLGENENLLVFVRRYDGSQPWLARIKNGVMTDSVSYSDFTVTEKKMHCVSMFIPQDPALSNYARYNEDIKQFEWYKVCLQ